MRPSQLYIETASFYIWSDYRVCLFISNLKTILIRTANSFYEFKVVPSGIFCVVSVSCKVGYDVFILWRSFVKSPISYQAFRQWIYPAYIVFQFSCRTSYSPYTSFAYISIHITVVCCRLTDIERCVLILSISLC